MAEKKVFFSTSTHHGAGQGRAGGDGSRLAAREGRARESGAGCEGEGHFNWLKRGGGVGED